MFIKRKEFSELQDYKKRCKALEDEVQRLSALITAEVKDCKIGPWCKDCKHCGYDIANTMEFDLFGWHPYVAYSDGKTQYCKKHIHEMCPEISIR